MRFSRSLMTMALVGFAFASVPVIESCSTNQPARVQMKDSEITTKVKTKFIGDPEVKAHDINVTTEEGVVYLTGRVDNQQQKDEAERLARNTNGVRDVVNHLKVGEYKK